MLLLINPEPEIMNMSKSVTETATDGLLREPINKRYLSKLIETALTSRLGLDGMAYASDVEPDGRKAKRVMRDLLDAGFIKINRARPDTYTVEADVVLAQVTPVKPTLQVTDWQRSTIIEGRAPIGCKFAEFTQGERLWMLTHADEYHWQWVERHNMTNWKPGDKLPERAWSSTLMVSDQALIDELVAARRAHKVTSLMKENVASALKNLANLDGSLVDTFMSIAALGFSMNDSFTGDPTTWAETAKRYVERADAKLKKAQAQVDAAKDVAAEIAEYGGWDKLGAELLTAINERLDKEDKA